MLRRLFGHMRQNAVAWLALFVAMGGTSAYAANTIGSTDIIDGQVKSVDIGNNEIGSSDVKDNSLNTFDVHSFLGVDVVDGTLTGADIGDGSLDLHDIGTGTVLPSLNIGTIPATNCVSFTIDLPGAYQSSQLLLTPKFDAHPALVYSVRNSVRLGEAVIIVCNFAGGPIDDGQTNFVLTNLDV